MIRLAANVSMLFGELPFPDRIAAAAEVGFPAVECQFPYAWPAEELAERLTDAGIPLVLMNLFPGAQPEDRGLAAVAGRDDEFDAALDQACHYATVLGCPRVHVMAGCPADPRATDRYVQRLRRAADRLATVGVEALIEPLNRRDMPGYLLSSTQQAERVIARVDRPNLRLQFDTYHLQILEGDLLATFRRCRELIGHVQIAAVADRGEPGEGEVDHHWLLRAIDAEGYTGWIGCEYRPRAGTRDGLGWAERYGIRP